MPRPRLRRRIHGNPSVTYYKPAGVPMRTLITEELTHEEWEALRLRYIKKLDQNASAKEMGTSQSTLQRILSNAHEKIGGAVVRGSAIKIVQ